jgi:Na+/H+ antiporter NhaD/arsenite permease-like protein
LCTTTVSADWPIDCLACGLGTTPAGLRKGYTVSIIILAVVFVLIAIRKVGNVRIQIWQAMLLGAVAVLLARQISPLAALKAINPDVMLFLFGMFIVGEALEASGYLAHVSYRIFRRARSMDTLVLAVLFVTGLLAAFLMNDTLAIIGTPVVLLLARHAGAPPRMMLLTLAFAVTIGTVMSPIGNPQNLLIAVSGGIENPFVTFFRYLFVPTVINLLIAHAFLRLFYRRHFQHHQIDHKHAPISDPALARLVQVSLAIIAVLVLAKVSLVFAGVQVDFRLTYIALAAALPVVAFSPRRLGILKNINWTTLVFFAAMFVLMESVWDSGFFQSLISRTSLNVASEGVIFAVSVVLSQFVSNVPLVALYLPVLSHVSVTVKQLMALAAGSTIAGNLSILGAASNVIIIQNAEQKSGETITFLEFVKIGVPLTAVNTLVYWLFLKLVS